MNQARLFWAFCGLLMIACAAPTPAPTTATLPERTLDSLDATDSKERANDVEPPLAIGGLPAVITTELPRYTAPETSWLSTAESAYSAECSNVGAQVDSSRAIEAAWGLYRVPEPAKNRN